MTPLYLLFTAIKKMLLGLGAGFVLTVLVCPPSAAQTWKPLCVSGGGTQGAHNGTWQRLNSPAAGGGTWKSLSGCGPTYTTYSYSMTAEYDNSSSIGYRSVQMGSLGPMGSISSRDLKGASIYEVVQYTNMVEICLTGTLPVSFFSTFSIAGYTFTTSTCSSVQGGPCYFSSSFDGSGSEVSCWDFNGATGISYGRSYAFTFTS